MRAELVASLAADHGIQLAAAIELRAALSESEQQAARDVEVQGARNCRRS